jgi:hypothetical protein
MSQADTLSHTPVIIIGAARSGTNMLRDVLTSLEDIGTWPCDEINYIWRYGNSDYPTDAIPPSLATKEVREYIRRAFIKMAHRTDSRILVEKTCANSLRVPFVDAVLPEAKFLHIVRDGADVVHSAMKRWRARPELTYLARKARFVPPREIPYYAVRFLRNQWYRVTSSDGTLKTWGPRYPGIDDLVQETDLATVCATQWATSVETAAADLDRLDPDRVYRIQYETFVAEPEQSLRDLLRFIDAGPRNAEDLRAAVAGVSASSVGRGRRGLSEADHDSAFAVLAPVLREQGYRT